MFSASGQLRTYHKNQNAGIYPETEKSRDQLNLCSNGCKRRKTYVVAAGRVPKVTSTFVDALFLMTVTTSKSLGKVLASK